MIRREIMLWPPIVAALFALSAAGTAVAGKQLSADEVKALVTGKTVHSYHLKKKEQIKTYYNSDGTMVALRGGDKIDGNWSVKPDGSHCLNFGDETKCAVIEDNGDGTYVRVFPNGKKFVVMKNFTNGNALK